MKNGYSIAIIKDSLGREIFREYNNEVGNPTLYIQYDTIHTFKTIYEGEKEIIEYERISEIIYWYYGKDKSSYIDRRVITRDFKDKETERLEMENTNHNFDKKIKIKK
jgi:hypothetical protein